MKLRTLLLILALMTIAGCEKRIITTITAPCPCPADSTCDRPDEDDDDECDRHHGDKR